MPSAHALDSAQARQPLFGSLLEAVSNMSSSEVTNWDFLTYIAIERATYYSSGKSNPKVGSEPNKQEGCNGTCTSYENDRLATNPVRKCAPKHSTTCFGLRQR